MDFDPGTLFASFVVGSIGFVLSAYGKKMSRAPHVIFGFLLMVSSFVPSVALMVGIAVVLIAGLVVATRSGM